MIFLIRKKERKDCFDVAYVVTVVWNETYRGIVPDEFLDNLYLNEEKRGKSSFEKFNEKENYSCFNNYFNYYYCNGSGCKE